MNDDVGQSTSPAVRLRTARWSDPRFWVGALLVSGSVLLGASLLADDDAVAVWRVGTDVGAGEPVRAAEFERVLVGLGDDHEALYITADGPPPGAGGTFVWAHDVQAGELVARSAVVDGDRISEVELPLRVAPGHAPADLRAGQWVDVWSSGGPDGQASRILADVRVVAVQEPTAALGGSGERVALVALPVGSDLTGVVDGADAESITLVRLPGPAS